MSRKSRTEQLWDNKRANVSDILAHFTCESSLAAISPKFPLSALEAKVTHIQLREQSVEGGGGGGVI
jgi:hypothetical protein